VRIRRRLREVSPTDRTHSNHDVERNVGNHGHTGNVGTQYYIVLAFRPHCQLRLQAILVAIFRSAKMSTQSSLPNLIRYTLQHEICKITRKDSIQNGNGQLRSCSASFPMEECIGAQVRASVFAYARPSTSFLSRVCLQVGPCLHLDRSRSFKKQIKAFIVCKDEEFEVPVSIPAHLRNVKIDLKRVKPVLANAASKCLDNSARVGLFHVTFRHARRGLPLPDVKVSLYLAFTRSTL